MQDLGYYSNTLGHITVFKVARQNWKVILGLVEVTLVIIFFLESSVSKGDMLFDILLASQLLPSNFPPHHDRVALGQKLYTIQQLYVGFTNPAHRHWQTNSSVAFCVLCDYVGTTKTYQLTTKCHISL